MLILNKTVCFLFHKLVHCLTQIVDGIFVSGRHRIHHTMAHMVFQDDLARIVQCAAHRRQLDEHLGALVPLLHHPLHLFQMPDGSSQAIDHRFLILVDMTVGMGDAVGVHVGMIVFVIMIVFGVMFCHSFASLYIFSIIPYFYPTCKPYRGIFSPEKN